MKKLLLALIASSAALAFADTPANPVYAQLQAGASFSPEYNSGTNGGGAVRFDVGYMFNPFVGIEGGFTGATTPASSTTAGSSALQFYDISVKGVLPLGEVFNIHGQIGGAYVSGGINSLGGTDATPKALLGAGVDFNLTRQFSITLNDYQYLAAEGGTTSGSGGNTNIVMGGVGFKF